MTTTAQSIIKSAQETLQDVDGIRWPATELVAHLNDGQRDIVALRPDMSIKLVAYPLAAGAKQATPADCSKLAEATRNTNGAAVRQTERNLLDAVEPSWYTQTGVTTIKHFCYDPRENNFFWVYPPAALGASLDLEYAAMPVDVATPSGAAYSTVTGNISVNDLFKNALTHFVLFRAYAKDAEFGGNAALSSAHYQIFKACLSADATTGQAVQPTPQN